MNSKIGLIGICIMAFLLLLFIGCSVYQEKPQDKENNVNIENKVFSSSESDISNCKMICTSHDWFYMKVTVRGIYTTTCYCIDKEGAIWTFGF